VVGSAGFEAGAQQAHVTACHATGSRTNPYVVISPSVSGTFHGHYRQHERDIIPPFHYQENTYSLNWGADGRAVQNAAIQKLARLLPLGTLVTIH